VRTRRPLLAIGALLALGLTILVASDSLHDSSVEEPPGRPAPPPDEPPPVDLTLFADEPDVRPTPARNGAGGTTTRGERLGGRVTTTDGRPVEGAEVICVRREKDGGTTRATARTDGHGRWEVDVPPGGAWHVQVSGSLAGGVPLLRKGSGTVQSGRLDVSLAVEAEDEFRGTVLDPEGRTVPEATVELWSSKLRGRGPQFRTTTDDAGAFRVLLPAGGTARIKAYVPTTEDVGLPYCRAFASDVKPDDPVDLNLTAGAEIRGRITWREGGPADGIPLRAHQKLGSHPMFIRARTNALGEFRIGGLFASMEYRLEIDGGRYEGKPLDLIGETRVKAGRTDVELQVAAAVLVTGTLHRPNGNPASRWKFWFVHEGSPRKIYCLTGKDGTFVLRVPEDGAYTAWTRYRANGRTHTLRIGTLRSGDSGVVLQIPNP